MRRMLFGLPRLDIAVAVGLLVVKLGAMATGAQPGGGIASWLLTPLWTLPLAWRRRAPLAAALVIAATNVVEIGLVGSYNSIVFLAVFLLIPYSLAAHERSAARMTVGLAALVASGGVSQAAQPSPVRCAAG